MRADEVTDNARFDARYLLLFLSVACSVYIGRDIRVATDSNIHFVIQNIIIPI